jgi:predicted TIM-barrel fold metal-dependent hydrolase
MSLKERLNFPPDPNPKTPKLKLPPGSWDTHFHVLGPPHLFPYAESRHYTPPAAPVEHYLQVAKVLGLERGVIVQPSVHVHDYAIVLDAIRKSDGRLRGVIRGECLEGADLKALHREGVRGVRIELRSAHRTFEPKVFDRMVARVAEAGWVVALHVDPGTIVTLADQIRRLPVTTIIENYALIDARLGLDQPALRSLLDLAAEPHIWLKTASAYRMKFKGATPEQILAVARIVHSRSPDRTIWGTDWPHSEVYAPGNMPNDGDIVDTLLDFVPDETVRRKLLVDNPKRLFDAP